MSTIRYVERCTSCGSLTVDSLVVDPARKEIRHGGCAVSLRPTHMLIAERLIAAAGNVVRHAQIIDHVWGDDEDGGPDDPQRAIFVGIVHLRRALASIGAPIQIETVHSVGYRLVASADVAGAGRNGTEEAAPCLE